MNRRRAERDLGVPLGVKEIRAEDARPHRGRFDDGDGVDARGPLEHESLAVAAQRRGDA
ncbi:MAG TPA: hypothetical protein VHW04_07620 [Solirubrobacteraceae bacterium]|nr:hypothetical protein [Solirubrobacteraceae bacterium]